MEFITMPPEITSALIHSGPGAESLVGASEAWQQLGIVLEDQAENYAATLSSMTADWHGPSAAAMAQAAEPYLNWLNVTAAQTQQIAVSAQAAAGAYNLVRASVVPVAVVMANRTQLVHLVATNVFGMNLPAIAENEAQYQAMWANNSAAMTGYQAASAQATTPLPQFSSPTSTTNPAGQGTQAGAVSAANSSATSAATTSSAPALSAASTAAVLPTDFDPQAGLVGEINQYANQFLSSGFPFNLLGVLAQAQSAQALQGVSGSIGTGLSEGEEAFGSSGGAAGALGALGAGGLGHVGGLGALGSAGLGEINTSAALGRGVSIGNLTAPPAVVELLQTSQQPVELASAASPLQSGAGGLPMLPPLMPPPLSPGSGWRKRKAQRYEDMEIGAELKGKIVRPPPSAG
jgi:PPE-repeat protein